MSVFRPQKRRKRTWDEAKGELSPYSRTGQAFNPYSPDNISNPYARMNAPRTQSKSETSSSAQEKESDIPSRS